MLYYFLSLNYKIFDLLCSDVIEKFGSDDRVFTQKYAVGKQRKRMYLLKPDDEDLDPAEILDLLNKLQEKYSYHSRWSPFYFSWYLLKYQNIKKSKH